MEYSSASGKEESTEFLFSTASVITGSVCSTRPYRVELCGASEISLGNYLENDLFDQTRFCEFCKEPAEAHIISYTCVQGNLKFSVRRVPSLKLEGVEDGMIWTWHRCLICEQIDGIPPAATRRRTVMSDADLGLSFGKFLVLCFSNYATGDQLAPCGHSLQRDCVQYYGFGSMVTSLQFSAVKMFSVCLPSSILDSNASVAYLLSDVAAVYDNEPTRAISYALNSKEYKDQIGDKPLLSESDESVYDIESNWVDFDPVKSDSSTTDQKTSHHVTISFEDDSPNVLGKVKKKFSVTCYFAEQFDALRKRCCVRELDFVRSLSCCSAMGGKTNNAYFAKSLDERFIIKQVTNTELEYFEKFAPEYLKYLTDSLRFGSATCLTKIVGMYQVATHVLDGDNKKTTMELIVMENVFFERKISGVYSIKDSARSHNISKATDASEVLLDMDVSEAVHTIPIFLLSKEKRKLQRAVWNDTSFLANVEVRGYSLVVGVDEERQELVFGIFDFMAKYNMHLEIWIHLMKQYTSSCILGGTKKDDSPTAVIPPVQYKKRFRRLVDKSFLGVS